MKVNKLMLAEGPSDYYDPTFRGVLEDHLSYLRNLSTTSMINVEPSRAYKFEFDLFSLLNSYNVPPQYQWLIMRMNKMVMPTELKRDMLYLFVPDFTEVEGIRQAFRTTRSIT